MPDYFADPTFVLFGKLALAAFLGMLLGTERVIAGKEAGTRTFALVALGSCLMVVMSNTVTGSYLGFVNFDPLRVAAAIVSGIGFLGAGIIVFRTRDGGSHGFTTAAAIWVAAAVGMAVGYGLYSISIFTTALTLFIFTAVWFLESWLKDFIVKQNWIGKAGGGQGEVPRYGDE